MDLIPLHSQLISIISSFFDDSEYDILIKKELLPITKKYPFYTDHTYFDRSESRCNGLLHSKGDEPTVVYCNGTKEWYKYGERHREIGPAFINNYKEEWWKNGKQHRDGDLPSVIMYNDKKLFKREWRINGLIHRDGDQPAVIYQNGSKFWYKHGKPHRDGDKPAVYSGSMIWYKDGKRHRDENKPAVIHHDRSREWWYNGKMYRFEEKKNEE